MEDLVTHSYSPNRLPWMPPNTYSFSVWLRNPPERNQGANTCELNCNHANVIITSLTAIRASIKCQTEAVFNLRHKRARHIWQCHRFLLFAYQTDLELGLFVRSIETGEGATCVNGWELRARQPSENEWERRESDFIFGLENSSTTSPVAHRRPRQRFNYFGLSLSLSSYKTR